jgi:hypothetical protein
MRAIRHNASGERPGISPAPQPASPPSAVRARRAKASATAGPSAIDSRPSQICRLRSFYSPRPKSLPFALPVPVPSRYSFPAAASAVSRPKSKKFRLIQDRSGRFRPIQAYSSQFNPKKNPGHLIVSPPSPCSAFHSPANSAGEPSVRDRRGRTHRRRDDSGDFVVIRAHSGQKNIVGRINHRSCVGCALGPIAQNVQTPVPVKRGESYGGGYGGRRLRRETKPLAAGLRQCRMPGQHESSRKPRAG